MSTQPIYQASPIKPKRKRRTNADMNTLRSEIVDVLSDFHPQTVRQVYYQLVSRGVVEKTENEYNAVQREIVRLRLEGSVPFTHIADNTRWIRKPTTFDSVAEALQDTAQYYRRALWSDTEVYVEVWCEKDAIAGVIHEVTEEYDVPLLPARGFSSITFLQSSAMVLEYQERPCFIYYFGDHDPSGLAIDQSIERRLRQFAPNADLHFERVAVTLDIIEQLQLPTRPTKKSDSRSKGFNGGSVDVDAIPARVLQSMVRECIEKHIDPDQLHRMQMVEREERETIKQIARNLLIS